MPGEDFDLRTSDFGLRISDFGFDLSAHAIIADCRRAPAQAVYRISHDPTKRLPSLIATLDSVAAPSSQRSVDVDLKPVRALEAIEEMGPAAKAAVPGIERVPAFSMASGHAATRTLRALDEAQ